jgi:hypothetical protein
MKSGPMRYSVDRSTLAADTWSGLEAWCPAGTRVASGGGAISVRSLAGGDTTALFPADNALDLDSIDDDMFGVRFVNSSDKQHVMRAVAVCLAREEETLDYQAASESLPGGGYGRDIDCASSDRATGGGFVSTGDPDEIHLARFFPDFDPDPPAEGWHTVFTLQGMGNKTVTRWAICLPTGSFALMYRRSTATFDQGERGLLKRRCPDGTRAAGGGLQAFSQINLLAASVPYDDDDERGKAPDDGWKVRFQSGVDDNAVTVWAICLRRLTS